MPHCITNLWGKIWPSKDEPTKQDDAALAPELLEKKEILDNALKKRLKAQDKLENIQRIMLEGVQVMEDVLKKFQDGNQVLEDDQQSLNEWAQRWQKTKQRYQKYSDSALKEYESACQDEKRALEELEQAIESYNNEGNTTYSNEFPESTESPVKANPDTKQTSPMGQDSLTEEGTTADL